MSNALLASSPRLSKQVKQQLLSTSRLRQQPAGEILLVKYQRFHNIITWLAVDSIHIDMWYIDMTNER